MPATLIQLNAQLDTLRGAAATGVLSVQHGEKRVQYRSMAEIQAAISIVTQQIADLGGNAVIRSFKLRTGKGL